MSPPHPSLGWRGPPSPPQPCLRKPGEPWLPHLQALILQRGTEAQSQCLTSLRPHSKSQGPFPALPEDSVLKGCWHLSTEQTAFLFSLLPLLFCVSTPSYSICLRRTLVVLNVGPHTHRPLGSGSDEYPRNPPHDDLALLCLGPQRLSLEW